MSGAVARRGVKGRGDSMVGRGGKDVVKGNSWTSSMTSSSTGGVMTTGGWGKGGSMMTMMQPA